MEHLFKALLLSLSVLLFITTTQAQNPPARLKYFGFALVDYRVDDPNDSSTITNYTTEVDTFSNVAQMGIHYNDTIIDRVNLMNAHCMKPILSTSSIFVFRKDSLGPSGSNYDLYPDYLTRWNTFKTINASVLNSGQIEVFYVCDEPTWNGVTFSELNTICSVMKADFPDIPLMFVEAFTEVAQVQVPTTVDWIGFDHYGIYDVSTDPSYLNWLHTLESRRSTSKQKIWLVFDDEWNSGYWPAGWKPDTMEQVLEHYYDLALADTNVTGLAGFTWPGIAPGWLGARSLPQNVKDKTIELGKKIKANYNPCAVAAVQNNSFNPDVDVYPNPAHDKLNFTLPQNYGITLVKIYNSLGEEIRQLSINGGFASIPIENISTGIYFYQMTGSGFFSSGKFIKK